MTKHDTVRVHYWEYTYRKDMSDPGGLYIATDLKAIPEVVRPHAIARFTDIPSRIYVEANFDLRAWLTEEKRRMMLQAERDAEISATVKFNKDVTWGMHPRVKR